MMIFSRLVGALALFRLSLDVAHAFISPSTTAFDCARQASPASFMQTTPFLAVHQQEASRRGVARIPLSSRRKASTSLGLARRNRRPSEDDDFEYFDDEDEDEEYFQRSYDRQGGADDEVLIRRRTMIWVTLAIVPDWTCHLLTVVEMDGDCRSPCQRRCWLGSLSWVLGWV